MTYDTTIGDLSYNCFQKLGKSGKPQPKSEFTVLSAIVCDYYNKNSNTSGIESKVVALTTGTKCYPNNQSFKDNLIVDSHSESLLKRAFKRHLISCLENGLDIHSDITRNLFISQLPCGLVQRWKGDPNPISESRLPSGLNRKPGRGEVCLRATCLKKIAKWVYLGLQGQHLIAYTKHPIYINSIVIGNCGQIGEFDRQLMAEAITLKDNCITYSPFRFNRLPEIKFCQQFRNELFIKSDAKQPTPTAIVMWLTGDGQTVTEVLTDGHRLGLTKKNMTRNPLLISDSYIKRDINSLDIEKDIKISESYENQWKELKKCKLFDGWP